MKTKLILVLLALGMFCLFSCSVEKREPAYPQYQIAIELLDQRGNNISEIAGAKTAGEVYYAGCTHEKLVPSFYSLAGSDGVRYFMMQADGLSSDGDHTRLIWALKCKDIFGDDEIHTINSTWYRQGGTYLRQCVLFEVEGASCVPELKNGLWTARVVVNR